MLCADISHKILRTDTVWGLPERAPWPSKELPRAGNSGSCGGDCADTVGIFITVGQCESLHLSLATCSDIPRYNNKTYRIDDIDWDKNPRSVFKTPSGDITFVQYYRKVSTSITCTNLFEFI